MNQTPHSPINSNFTPAFERKALWLMALVQFINIWDFMIVMPLGPDLAAAVGLSNSHIGWITASYSISAAIISIAAARILDQFDRRSVLIFNLIGLAIATAGMAFAQSATSLIAVRIITGLFGGTMIASSLAVITDIFPPQRRGEAMGKVFGSFAIAAVMGVPLGLEIATRMIWWAPFMVIGAVALITAASIRIMLPPMRYHLQSQPTSTHKDIYASLLANPLVWMAFCLAALSLFAGFMIIPNISAHLMLNMNYPREKLGFLYFIGGLTTLFTMRYAGKRADRKGFANTAMWATLIVVISLMTGFYLQIKTIPMLAIFVLFMVGMSTRNVTSSALASKIPAPHERAGFMALLSAVQSIFQGLGALISTLLLSQSSNQQSLDGMDDVALVAMLCFILSVGMTYHLERQLLQRELTA